MLNGTGRSKYRRRSSGDPLGLAGELERCKRGWDPALRDPLDDFAHLEEGIHGRGGREHREGADPEESEE